MSQFYLPYCILVLELPEEIRRLECLKELISLEQAFVIFHKHRHRKQKAGVLHRELLLSGGASIVLVVLAADCIHFHRSDCLSVRAKLEVTSSDIKCDSCFLRVCDWVDLGSAIDSACICDEIINVTESINIIEVFGRAFFGTTIVALQRQRNAYLWKPDAFEWHAATFLEVEKWQEVKTLRGSNDNPEAKRIKALLEKRVNYIDRPCGCLEIADFVIKLSVNLNEPKDSSKTNKAAQNGRTLKSLTLEIYHGGWFAPTPSRSYIGGQVSSVNVVDIDEFCLHDLKDMVVKLGYGVEDLMYCHFLIPSLGLDYGLHSLNVDANVLEMSKYVKDYKIILVYVEHESSNVDTSMFDSSPDVNRNVKKEWEKPASSVARPIIVESVVDPFDGLDEIQGQILTTVGADANNGIYPVAYVIVEAESKASWCWFLNLLIEDLGIESNFNYTFISDREKGLIQAIASMFPSAEHKYCVRHIHENMKSQFKGGELKSFNSNAYGWLMKIVLEQWSRAYFSGRAKCDLLINNICKMFNRQLVDGRDQPIITCLEYIREYLMKRIVVVQKVIAKTVGPLTPSVTKIRICSYKKWELTGIPCKHALAAIYNMSENSVGVNPYNGRDMWPVVESRTVIIPPLYKPSVGKPLKKRKKSNDDIASQSASSGNLSRKGKSVSCGKCGNVGHNKKGFRGQGGVPSQAGARNVSSQAVGSRKVSSQAAGARNVFGQAAGARKASSQPSAA
ncbi:zinc finger, CCHC-type containing protein [Tanacetum coccineum]|uniref:Zinc finger, CCHC-type containing protein n=1 Tax=Tanacetum coccineum TaxID=301880 RepID=A0ABQ4ZP51_9ASTR